MIPKLAREIDQALDQQSSDPFASPVALDVDREVDDVIVRFARAETIEARPTDDDVVGIGDDHRIPRRAVDEPQAPFRWCSEGGLECRNSVRDALVANRADGRGIVCARGTKRDRHVISLLLGLVGSG